MMTAQKLEILTQLLEDNIIDAKKALDLLNTPELINDNLQYAIEKAAIKEFQSKLEEEFKK